jgi:lysophospholipase L1-like esterase
MFLSLTSYAQDWANLEFYQNQNESALQLSDSERSVVFMGNSITQQWKEKHPMFFRDNGFLCRGISGQTSPQMLLRFRQDVIQLQPKIVVILAGTNDIAGNTGESTLEMILNNIASMTELAKANGIVPVLCSVLPAYDYPWKKGREPNIKIPQFNDLLKKYATENDVIFVDYFSSMANDVNGMKAELTYDGVHCTLEGYDVMERIILPVLQDILNN